MKADLKTPYTVQDEPAIPNKNWDEYLNSLGTDALGKKDPGSPWPSGKGKGFETHAHHIVMKEGGPAVADAAFVARQILRMNGINPYTDQANLVWVPNWSHTQEYARDVLAALLPVKDQGAAAVEQVLKQLVRRFIAGEWYVP